MKGIFAFCLALATSLAALAQAQQDPAYPSQPITVVAATLPGSGAEAELRQFLSRITASTGTQFVVVHKPGAGGTIGAAFVAKAKPDGYTLLLGDGNFTAAPALYNTLPFDAVKDFAPVSVLLTGPAALLVNASLPMNNARDYFAYAKANPGKLNFGVVSAGTRLNAQALHRAAGVEVTVVDYKGTSEMMTDLLSGRIDATVLTPLFTTPYVKAGRLKWLGLTASERSDRLPDLLTVAEQGAPSYRYGRWVGLLAPAGTPPGVIGKLHAMLVAAGQDPALRQRAQTEITDLVVSTPVLAAEYIHAEMKYWRSVAQK